MCDYTYPPSLKSYVTLTFLSITLEQFISLSELSEILSSRLYIILPQIKPNSKSHIVPFFFLVDNILIRGPLWKGEASLMALQSRISLKCRRHKRHEFDPWVGKIPWVGNGNPLQHSCLKNSMDREAWQTSVHGTVREKVQFPIKKSLLPSV